jgi:negative regulator of genetic competence, sporulation and motility
LIRYSVFVRLEKKWEYSGTVHKLFIDFEKAYDSGDREVLYSIISEFGTPTTLIGLIKIRLNETYGKVHISKNLSDAFSILNA